jgi:predicted RNase H-like HicB family nuclease
MSMLRSLTAVIEREGDGYVAICPEFDVASQGNTVEEARSNLTEALTLFFETADAAEIDRRSQREVFVTQVEVAVG